MLEPQTSKSALNCALSLTPHARLIHEQILLPESLEWDQRLAMSHLSPPAQRLLWPESPETLLQELPDRPPSVPPCPPAVHAKPSSRGGPLETEIRPRHFFAPKDAPAPSVSNPSLRNDLNDSNHVATHYSDLISYGSAPHSLYSSRPGLPAALWILQTRLYHRTFALVPTRTCCSRMLLPIIFTSSLSSVFAQVFAKSFPDDPNKSRSFLIPAPAPWTIVLLGFLHHTYLLLIHRLTDYDF